jgi:hypothetical protein
VSNPGSGADLVRWGELRQVLAGTTSVAGSGGQAGLLRNVDRVNISATAANQEGLGEPPLFFDTFPLGDSAGAELTSGCDYPSIVTPRELPGQSSYLPHVAEGIETSARNEFRCLTGQGTGSQDIIRARTAVIHGVGLTAEDIGIMAERGAGLIWSPRSNLSLYGETAMVPAFRRMGVNIALGSDWLQSGSMNVLRELQCADYLNTSYYGYTFSDEQLWRMVTASAADLTDTWEKVGRIARGKVADLAIFRLRSFATNPHRAVITANPEDVVLTVRGGKPLYGDQAVVTALTQDECDALEVCGAAKVVCVKSEVGKTLAELQAANTSTYPLFFCGTQPQDEPTCTPQRASVNASWPGSVNGSTAYNGERNAGDLDGDGIPNPQDNCPTRFNPVRPLDNGAQADSDGDGRGDACDACPLSTSESCTAPDPLDDDRDSVATLVDNCPFVANVEQTDTDQDGKGDACDACATANPGNIPCTVSLYAVKERVNGARPFLNETIAIDDALVTATAGNSYFLQVHESEPGYRGPAWSGLYVFSSSATGLAAGDRIHILSGVVQDYFGQIQLTSAAFVKLSSGNPLPAPVSVTPAEVRTGGPRAEELEGVLVQLDNVFVTKQEPSVGPGDRAPTNEFVVDSTAGTDGEAAGVRVNDSIYRASPLPAVGTAYSYVRGVLNWRNDHSKVEPRSAADLKLP